MCNWRDDPGSHLCPAERDEAVILMKGRRICSSFIGIPRIHGENRSGLFYSGQKADDVI